MMARFECNDLASLLMDMRELASLPDSTLSDMLDAEADIVVDAQKSSARSMGVYDTGALAASIKKGSAKRTSSGMSLSITPSGSRRRGKVTTRNAEIAFINEYGKRGQPARPFINKANEQSADRAVSAAEKVYDNFLKSKNL